MNRTLNQLINQLHLDPKKEAAVRKIVENAVSNNQSGGSNSSGNEPVIIELPFGDEEIGAVSLSEKQINACKNQNIKLKAYMADDNYMILIPYFYGIGEENIVFYVRWINSRGNIVDSTFSIDVINKTITAID